MGRSSKPDISYRFADHARYLDAWFDALDLDRVVLIGHDWGGALAFDWAARHPQRVGGIAFLESIVKPMAWQELSPQARERAELIRTPGTGEQLVRDQNLFVRTAFTGGVLTPVSDQDLAGIPGSLPDPRESPPHPGLGAPATAGRRAGRAGRPHPGVRRMAGDQHERPEAADDLRGLAHPADRQADGRLVCDPYRRA
jgi:pimeloyl-ACP methyl ester carboxylesterase